MKILTPKRERLLSAEMTRLRNENTLLRSHGAGELADQIAALQGHLKQLHEINARVYFERNHCVALIATLAHERGWPVGRKVPLSFEDWASEGWPKDEDPLNCIYIDLPAGQVSWHYLDKDAWLFAHLPLYGGRWDGHTTEEKYQRVHEQTVSYVFP
jgi:hypothetical protein